MAQTSVYPVSIDAEGVFFAEISGNVVTFWTDGGVRLTDSSISQGCWPICFVETEQDKFLYFEFFLSSTVHKWLLAPDLTRSLGIDVDQAEVSAVLAQLPKDAQHDWLRAKLVDREIRIDEVQASPESEFSRLEYSLLRALTQRTLREFVLNIDPRNDRFADGKKNAVLLTARTARFCLTMAGYRDPVRLVAKESLQHDNIFEYISSHSSEVNFMQIAKSLIALNSIFDNMNANKSYTFSKFIFGGAARLPDVGCKITYNPSDLIHHVDGQTCFVFRIHFSESIILRWPPDALTSAFIPRFGHSLESLRSHFLRLAEARRDGFALSFCFSDHGLEDYICFDRPRHSKRKLIPDLYVLSDSRSASSYPMLTSHAFARAFEKKQPKLFWRGSTTGSGSRNLEDLKNNPRVQACLEIKNKIPKVSDCKITFLAQCDFDHTIALEYLKAEGLLDKYVEPEEFGKYQLYLDLPGNCAAWGTYQKFLLGCAIVRPVPTARELYYYDLLEENKDYIPVNADLSNISEVVEAAIADPARTSLIAYSGRRKMIGFLRDLPEHVFQVLNSAISLSRTETQPKL